MDGLFLSFGNVFPCCNSWSTTLSRWLRPIPSDYSSSLKSSLFLFSVTFSNSHNCCSSTLDSIRKCSQTSIDSTLGFSFRPELASCGGIHFASAAHLHNQCNPLCLKITQAITKTIASFWWADLLLLEAMLIAIAEVHGSWWTALAVPAWEVFQLSLVQFHGLPPHLLSIFCHSLVFICVYLIVQWVKYLWGKRQRVLQYSL